MGVAMRGKVQEEMASITAVACLLLWVGKGADGILMRCTALIPPCDAALSQRTVMVSKCFSMWIVQDVMASKCFSMWLCFVLI